MTKPMVWQKAEDVKFSREKFYLVKTNGMEWRDADLFVMPGPLAQMRMKPEIVRGRPIWVAEVTDPLEVSP